MSIFVNKELRDLIPPLSEEEYAQLEANIVAEGIRDPLVVWKQPDGREMLIDGHNRWNIAAHHSGLTFEVVYKDFKDLDEAKVWIYKNQLGRRNLDEWERFDLVKGLEALEAKNAKQRMSDGAKGTPILAEAKGETRDKLAEMVGVSHGKYSMMKAIDEKGTDALKKDVRNGDMSVNAAYLIATGKMSKSPRQLQREFVERKKEEHEDFKQKKAETVVNLQEIKEDRETIKILAREFHNDFSKIYSAVFATWMDIENDDNTDDILKSFEPDERSEMLLSLGMSQNLIAKIGGRIKQFE